jgi:hypothetical protein
VVLRDLFRVFLATWLGKPSQQVLVLFFSLPYPSRMRSRASDRIPRLASLPPTPEAFVRMAVCLGCHHVAPLPVRDLVRRYGELFPVEMALIHLRCEEC